MKYVTKNHIVIAILIFVTGLVFSMIFSFYQDYRRYFAIAALFMIIYGVINIPRLLAIRRKVSNFSRFVLFGIIINIGISVSTIIFWFQYNSNKLEKYGIKTKAVVISKEWLSQKNGGYQIIYSFKYNNEWIKTKEMSDNYNVGDTVTVRFVPDKPINNEIIDDN